MARTHNVNILNLIPNTHKVKSVTYWQYNECKKECKFKLQITIVTYFITLFWCGDTT